MHMKNDILDFQTFVEGLWLFPSVYVISWLLTTRHYNCQLFLTEKHLSILKITNFFVVAQCN